MANDYCNCLSMIPKNQTPLKEHEAKIKCVEKFLTVIGEAESTYNKEELKSISEAVYASLNTCGVNNIPDLDTLELEKKRLEYDKLLSGMEAEMKSKDQTENTILIEENENTTSPSFDKSVLEDISGEYKGKFGNDEIVLTISIKKDGTVIGNNLFKNKTTNMKGTLKLDNNDPDNEFYAIILEEPAGSGNGVFTITLTQTRNFGKWVSHNDKIKRECELQQTE